MKTELYKVSKIVTGGTPSTANNEYWSNGTIPWLQSGCCQNCYVTKASKYITQLGYDNSNTRLMPPNTVLIALTGATAGKIGYLTFKACGNQSITGITPDVKMLLPEYLYYFLIARRNKTLSDCTGGAQPHISQEYVKHIKINLPSLEEQEVIVKQLDLINDNIVNENKNLSLQNELIKSRFIELFPEDGDFEHDTLSSITTKITDGSHNPPKGVTFSEYIMASSQNVNDVLNLNDVRYLSKEDFDRENKRTDIQEGDVLFTIVGTIGRTYVIKSEKWYFNEALLLLSQKRISLTPFISNTFCHLILRPSKLILRLMVLHKKESIYRT